MKPWVAVAAAVPLATGCAVSEPPRTPAAEPPPPSSTQARDAGGALDRPRAARPPAVPPGTTAGYVVFDRVSGKIVAHRNARRKFRSASVVKILIALDLLNRTKTLSAEDARLLKVMLRSSDDDAATNLWNRGGKGAIVTRMARELRLRETTPPPASKPGFWGYVSLSAYDVVTTYRHLLDRADPRARDLVLGHLRKATRCGTDGFDQSFGIPAAVPRPWAVKQGWSGFGLTPPVRCGGDVSAGGGAISQVAFAASGTGVPDYGRPVLHTTGLVGKDERYAVALLTAHPAGGSWNASVKRVTTLARDLYRALP
ncbi:hypothetical protein [Nonomuraea longicatena]|uniref:Lipoprotein n=1 Tax=Nonomuraea longicatena TaxID=83682 RepID=A0ABP4BKY4_9ACTN